MKKTKRNMELILDQLRKTPVAESACQKIGISRMTLFRWKKEDLIFAKAVEEAIEDGRDLVNDVAVSQLLMAIKNGNLSAITYWLNHNHKNYANKLEISGKLKTDNIQLTSEQEAGIKQALKLACLLGNNGLVPSPESPEASTDYHDRKIVEIKNK